MPTTETLTFQVVLLEIASVTDIFLQLVSSLFVTTNKKITFKINYTSFTYFARWHFIYGKNGSWTDTSTSPGFVWGSRRGLHNLFGHPKKIIYITKYPGNMEKTRLHSSRMRTARTLTVSPSMLCSMGGAWSWGGLLRRGIPACTEADHPPPR